MLLQVLFPRQLEISKGAGGRSKLVWQWKLKCDGKSQIQGDDFCPLKPILTMESDKGVY